MNRPTPVRIHPPVRTLLDDYTRRTGNSINSVVNAALLYYLTRIASAPAVPAVAEVKASAGGDGPLDWD